MSAITIENDLVHYEVLGRGRPVIFVHGWLGSWRYWVPTMQQLSMKYRTYALDLWGFGDSGKQVNRYGFKDQVRLLYDFMEKLGIAKAALVGHSLGAAICLRFASQYPDRAPRVMLVSPPLFDLGGLNELPTNGQAAVVPPAPATISSAPAQVSATPVPATPVPPAPVAPAESKPAPAAAPSPAAPVAATSVPTTVVPPAPVAPAESKPAPAVTPSPAAPVAATPVPTTAVPPAPVAPAESKPAPAVTPSPAAPVPTPPVPTAPATQVVPGAPVESQPIPVVAPSPAAPVPASAVPDGTSGATAQPAVDAPLSASETLPRNPLRGLGSTSEEILANLQARNAVAEQASKPLPPAAPSLPINIGTPILPKTSPLTPPVPPASTTVPAPLPPAPVQPDIPNPLINLLSGIKPGALLIKHVDRDAPDLDKLRAEVEKTDEIALTRSAQSFTGVNLAVELHHLSSPTLLLHGQADPLIPPPDGNLIQRISQGKPDGHLLAFIEPDLRHFPMLEITAKFNRLLMDFLDAQDLTNVQFKDQWIRIFR